MELRGFKYGDVKFRERDEGVTASYPQRNTV